MKLRSFRTEGIILKRHGVGESDKLITFYSPTHGKMTAKAKGIRRLNSKRASHVELFNHVDLVLYDSSTPLIVEVTTKKHYGKFRQDITLASLAFYIGEVIDKIVPEHQPQQQIFSILSSVLAQLDALDFDDEKNKYEGERIVKNFVSLIMWELGYLPHGQYPQNGLTAMVEEICERRVNSRKFLQEQ